MFSFQVEENQKTPTVEFVSEEPYLQYVSLESKNNVDLELILRSKDTSPMIVVVFLVCLLLEHKVLDFYKEVSVIQ